jgi:hypothetical protein
MLTHSFIKSEFRHWIMLSVSRPQSCPARHGAGSNEGLTQFNGVALSITPQVLSGTAAYGNIDGNARESVEQSLKDGIF